VIAICGALAIAAACNDRGGPPPAGGPAQSAETGDLRIDFRSEPSPPQAGENSFEVIVQRRDGSPVTDANVTAVFTMPAMPSMNMPAMRSEAMLTHESSGRYRGIGRLSMAGTWNVAVTVGRGSEQLGSSQFSVIAK
jgi:hypothetical protein